jgi:hypothetical protein
MTQKKSYESAQETVPKSQVHIWEFIHLFESQECGDQEEQDSVTSESEDLPENLPRLAMYVQ